MGSGGRARVSQELPSDSTKEHSQAPGREQTDGGYSLAVRMSGEQGRKGNHRVREEKGGLCPTVLKGAATLSQENTPRGQGRTKHLVRDGPAPEQLCGTHSHVPWCSQGALQLPCPDLETTLEKVCSKWEQLANS